MIEILNSIHGNEGDNYKETWFLDVKFWLVENTVDGTTKWHMEGR